MNKLVETLVLVLLICVAVRIGAVLIAPILPLLVTTAVLVGLFALLLGRRGRGYW